MRPASGSARGSLILRILLMMWNVWVPISWGSGENLLELLDLRERFTAALHNGRVGPAGPVGILIELDLLSIFSLARYGHGTRLGLHNKCKSTSGGSTEGRWQMSAKKTVAMCFTACGVFSPYTTVDVASGAGGGNARWISCPIGL
jgi:hypothetical protein